MEGEGWRPHCTLTSNATRFSPTPLRSVCGRICGLRDAGGGDSRGTTLDGLLVRKLDSAALASLCSLQAQWRIAGHFCDWTTMVSSCSELDSAAVSRPSPNGYVGSVLRQPCVFEHATARCVRRDSFRLLLWPDGPRLRVCHRSLASVSVELRLAMHEYNGESMASLWSRVTQGALTPVQNPQDSVALSDFFYCSRCMSSELKPFSLSVEQAHQRLGVAEGVIHELQEPSNASRIKYSPQSG